jgi:anti-sigma-K factor RskA
VSEHDDRLRDDAAAWVLGALDETEIAAFARRLESSPELRKEVDDLREAADVLPHSVSPVAPPPELRDRIMAIVEAEAGVLHAADVTADRPVARRRTSAGWRSWLRPLPMVATACVLVLAGLAAGLLIAGGDAESTRTVAAQVTGVRSADAKAQVEIQGENAELVVDGMPAPAAGHVYQVWYLHDGQTEPVSAGALFDVDHAGHGAAALPGGLDGVQQVMVSVEPAGGSEKPTTQPVVSANLS